MNITAREIRYFLTLSETRNFTEAAQRCAISQPALSKAIKALETKLRERFAGVDLLKRYASERDDWIQAMVMAGLGISYVPEFSITIDGLVTRRLTDPEVTRTVKVVTVRGRPHNPATAAFVSATRSYPWKTRTPRSVPSSPAATS